MKYESRSTSGIPTSMIPAHVAALMNEPTYVTHLVFDESATKSFLVVVFGEEDSAKVRSGRGPAASASTRSVSKKVSTARATPAAKKRSTRGRG